MSTWNASPAGVQALKLDATDETQLSAGVVDFQNVISGCTYYLTSRVARATAAAGGYRRRPRKSTSTFSSTNPTGQVASPLRRHKIFVLLRFSNKSDLISRHSHSMV